MEIIINVKKLENSGLSLEKFVLLQAYVEELDIDLELISPSLAETLVELEMELYIKTIGGNVFPRQKALDLFNKKDADISFEQFWERYHDITGKPKTDKFPAEKYWNRLTKTRKKKAYDMISAYFDSLDNPKYCKKARTYLKDRNFEDKFTEEHSESDPFITKA